MGIEPGFCGLNIGDPPDIGGAATLRDFAVFAEAYVYARHMRGKFTPANFIGAVEQIEAEY